jgi:hypothetical protein
LIFKSIRDRSFEQGSSFDSNRVFSFIREALYDNSSNSSLPASSSSTIPALSKWSEFRRIMSSLQRSDDDGCEDGTDYTAWSHRQRGTDSADEKHAALSRASSMSAAPIDEAEIAKLKTRVFSPSSSSSLSDADLLRASKSLSSLFFSSAKPV